MMTTANCQHNEPNTSFDVEIDTNLYNIIVEWVRIGRKFSNKDELIQSILNEYEDRFLRSNRCLNCSRLIPNQQPDSNAIFKPKIAHDRRYTSRQVYSELTFIYDTNRYSVKKLLNECCDHAAGCCKPDVGVPCGCCPTAAFNTVVTVDEYIKNLIRTNYDQASFGLNKTSILMSLPSYINRQEFERKILTICDSDATTYKLKLDLEIF